MTKDPSGIFEWVEWDSLDALQNVYYKVKILKDFGLLNKGREFETLIVDYENCKMIASEDGETETLVIHYEWKPK